MISDYLKREKSANRDYTLFSFYRYGAKYFYPAIFLFCVISAISAFLPYFIKKFVEWLVDDTSKDSTGYYWALGLIGLRLVQFYLTQQFDILNGKGLLKLLTSIPVSCTLRITI